MARLFGRRLPNDRPTSRVKQSGFTLIELVIAVAIFAVVATTVYTRSGDTIRQLGVLEERTLALWVAENEMAMLRISRNNTDAEIPTSTITHQVEMGGREWRVEVRTSETSNPMLRRADVTVAHTDTPTTPVQTMTGFVGRY